MLKWVKKKTGEYESECGRFIIRKSLHKGVGPWQLLSKKDGESYKVVQDCDTMTECKDCAEYIVRRYE